jgi:hypothetical protein
MLAVLQGFHTHISTSTLSSPSISLLSCHNLELLYETKLLRRKNTHITKLKFMYKIELIWNEDTKL